MNRSLDAVGGRVVSETAMRIDAPGALRQGWPIDGEITSGTVRETAAAAVVAAAAAMLNAGISA